MNKEIGLFDVDSRQLNKEGCGLEFKKRVLPIADKLDQLYDFAYKYDLPLVFTTCCSGNFLKKNSLDYVCYVPMDQADLSWVENMEDYRYFYIEKRHYGNPRINCENCAYDIFRHNANGMELFKKLGVKNWAIFGDGFDICVKTAGEHLLANGFKMIIIENAISSARGGTPESKKIVIEKLKQKGAEAMTTDEFFRKYGRPEQG